MSLAAIVYALAVGTGVVAIVTTSITLTHACATLGFAAFTLDIL
jgi:hypothetical protein